MIPALVTQEELNGLKHYAALSPNRLILEIGTRTGYVSNQLASHCRDKTVITVDQVNTSGVELHNRHDVLQIVTASPFCIGMLLDLGMNTAIALAFIDGDHFYPGVSEDVHIVSPLLDENSFLALHDSRETGRKMTLEGTFWNGFREGPYRVVQELLSNGWRLEDEIDSISILKRVTLPEDG